MNYHPKGRHGGRALSANDNQDPGFYIDLPKAFPGSP